MDALHAIVIYTTNRLESTARGAIKEILSFFFSAERLTHTKKFESLVAAGDLYALPVTAVPGCGYMLGALLKKDGIQRASELYELFKKKKLKEFTKFLTCKVGAWNAVYVSTGERELVAFDRNKA